MNMPDWIEIKVEAEAKRRTEDLAALVTPKLSDLLERLATWTKVDDDWCSATPPRISKGLVADCTQARNLAAHFRGILEKGKEV